MDIMTSSGGKVLSAYVEEVSPMRTHLRDDHWRPYVIPNKVRVQLASRAGCMPDQMHQCLSHSHESRILLDCSLSTCMA